MRFSDAGCYGEEITTPNLDRLAAQYPDKIRQLSELWQRSEGRFRRMAAAPDQRQ